jgi:hypothetical protein
LKNGGFFCGCKESCNGFNHLAKGCGNDVSLGLEAMEKVMRARLMVIAAVLTIGTPAGAEPPTADAARPAQPQPRPAEIVLAAAEPVRASRPDNAQSGAAPVKHRVARVTTCRCGDQQVDPDSREQ